LSTEETNVPQENTPDSGKVDADGREDVWAVVAGADAMEGKNGDSVDSGTFL